MILKFKNSFLAITFLLFSFSSTANTNSKSYINFDEFSELINVKDMSLSSSIILGIQTFINPFSLQHLLPVFQYVISSSQCEKALLSEHTKGSSIVKALVIDWQIPKSKLNIKYLDNKLNQEEVKNIKSAFIEASRQDINGLAWLSYGKFLAEMKARNLLKLSDNSQAVIDINDLKEVLNFNQGQSFWLDLNIQANEKRASEGNIQITVCRNKYFAQNKTNWLAVENTSLDSLVEKSLKDSDGNLLTNEMIIFTVDKLNADQFKKNDFIVSCRRREYLLNHASYSSACKDKLTKLKIN